MQTEDLRSAWVTSLGGEVANSSGDAILQNHRAQIAALDLAVLQALNARIALVQGLKEYKAAKGLPFHDAAQEERVIARLCQANQGPMSEEGLRELYDFLLAWTKREAARLGATKAP